MGRLEARRENGHGSGGHSSRVERPPISIATQGGAAWQLASLISWRSEVRILSLLPDYRIEPMFYRIKQKGVRS